MRLQALLANAIVAGLLLGAADRTGAQDAKGQALDQLLDQLLVQAHEQPAAALAALRALPAAQRESTAGRTAEGRMLIAAGALDEALAVNEVLKGLPGGAAAALVLEALVLDGRGQNIEALALAQQARRLLEPACARGSDAAPGLPAGCDHRSLWQVHRMQSWASFSEGAFAEAATEARQALGLAEAAGDRRLAALSMGGLAMLSQQMDQPQEARRLIAAALGLAEGDPLLLSEIKEYEARVAVRRGDLLTQQRSYEEALALARAAGAVRQAAGVLISLTDLHMHAGRPAEALKLAREALPVVQRFKDSSSESTLRHNMGVSLIRLRQLDAARRELARSQALEGDRIGPARRAVRLREIGDAWAAAGEAREALRVFHEERELTAAIHARNQASQLAELRQRYDSEGEQRDLELLTRERSLKDQQLANRELARSVGIALAVLLSLSVVLVVLMLQRVRRANQRLKAKQQLLRAQSERDPLTDLANRRHFLAVMERHAQDCFDGALMMVDIDHFKHVNDRHGHAAGDTVICEVARRISDAVRQEDLVVRWGGEEFLVYAPKVGAEPLQQLAERVLLSVGREPVRTEAGALRITVSIGFAHFPLPPTRLPLHWERAVNWADMALYTAKAQGRNRAVGIATVDAADTEVLTQIEANFDAACNSQRVTLKHILGSE